MEQNRHPANQSDRQRGGMVVVGIALALLVLVIVWSQYASDGETTTDDTNTVSLPATTQPIELGNRTEARRYDRTAFGYAIELPPGYSTEVSSGAPVEGVIDVVTVASADGADTITVSILESGFVSVAAEAISGGDETSFTAAGAEGTLLYGKDEKGIDRHLVRFTLQDGTVLEMSGISETVERVAQTLILY